MANFIFAVAVNHKNAVAARPNAVAANLHHPCGCGKKEMRLRFLFGLSKLLLRYANAACQVKAAKR